MFPPFGFLKRDTVYFGIWQYTNFKTEIKAVSSERGRVVAQAVSHRLIAPKARVQNQFSSCGICGG